jgi:dolichol-phosphate mannosyltransferase
MAEETSQNVYPHRAAAGKRWSLGVDGVSVIMPTLNEAGHIEPLIRATVEALQAAGIPTIEILVLDDDSADRTWEVASRVACPPASVEVIRRMSNHGLTVSLMEGIGKASQDVVVWMDCDFSQPPEKIPQMLYMLGQGYDVAVNSRYVVGGGENRVGEGGATQRWISRFSNWVARFLLDASFSDYTSGFVAVRKKVLEDLPLRGDYGEYFIDFIFRAIRKKYKICELPYVMMPRRSGKSKTGANLLQFMRRGRKYILTLLRLRTATLTGRL